MLYLRDDDIKLAFATMINKLTYCHKLVLKPYLESLQVNTSDEALLRIQQLETFLHEGKLETLPDSRKISLSSESRRTVELVLTAMSRLQVTKLRLSTTQNLFKRTLSGNLQAFTLMTVFPVPTPRTVMNLIE